MALGRGPPGVDTIQHRLLLTGPQVAGRVLTALFFFHGKQ